MPGKEHYLERLVQAIDAAVAGGCGTRLSPSTWAACGPLLARLARPSSVRRAEAVLATALRWGPGADERLVVMALALVERLEAGGGRLVALAQCGGDLAAVLEDEGEPVSPHAFAHWVSALSYALFGEGMQGRLTTLPGLQAARPAA